MDIHSCMLNRRLAYSKNLKVSIHVMLLLSLRIPWQEGSFLIYKIRSRLETDGNP